MMVAVVVMVVVVVMVTTTDTGSTSSSMMVVLLLLRMRMIVATAAPFVARSTDGRRGRVLRTVMFAIRECAVAPIAPVSFGRNISPSDALVVAGLDRILRSQHRRTSW